MARFWSPPILLRPDPGNHARGWSSGIMALSCGSANRRREATKTLEESLRVCLGSDLDGMVGTGMDLSGNTQKPRRKGPSIQLRGHVHQIAQSWQCSASGSRRGGEAVKRLRYCTVRFSLRRMQSDSLQAPSQHKNLKDLEDPSFARRSFAIAG